MFLANSHLLLSSLPEFLQPTVALPRLHHRSLLSCYAMGDLAKMLAHHGLKADKCFGKELFGTYGISLITQSAHNIK